MTTRIAWLVALVVLLDACGTSAPAGPAPGDAATDAVEDGRDGGPDDAQSMEDAGGPDSAEDAEDATKGSEDVTPDAADLDAGDPGEVAPPDPDAGDGGGLDTDADALGSDAADAADTTVSDALDATTLDDATGGDATWADTPDSGSMPAETVGGDTTLEDTTLADSSGQDAGDAAGRDAVDAAEPDAGPTPVVCAPLPPWSRSTEGVGGTVTFSELMIDPAGGKDLEWVELHNPMTLDVDISGWRLADAVSYTFPVGTIVAGGAYLVVAADPGQLASTGGPVGALGPFQGSLSNEGEELRLVSNGDRLMDVVDYVASSPWPLGAFGSGASLAKVDPDGGSEWAEGWRASALVGGTPGARNFADPHPKTTFGPVVELNATWRFDASDIAPSAQWVSPGFDDGGWSEGQAVFYAGGDPSSTASVTAQVTADNFFALYAGSKGGEALTLVGRDTTSDWTTAETFGFDVASGDHAFIAAWEGPGDSASPQMVVAQLTLPGGETLETSPVTFEAVLGPDGANPGGSLADPPPALEALALLVAAADGAGSWAPPAVQADKAQAPWGWATGPAFGGSPKLVWIDTFAAASLTNTHETFALFRSVDPILPSLGQTELPPGVATVYLRTTFVIEGAPELAKLWIETIADDGAVVYLNGVEVHRQNMPDGPVSHSTLALEPVESPEVGFAVPLPTDALLPGENVLAVEVHQAQAGDPDMTFGARLLASTTIPGAALPGPTLVFNEASAAGASPWVELANATDAPLDLGGASILHPGGSVPLPETELAPGALLLIDAELGASIGAGERLFLLGAASEVLDAVEVASVPRARETPGDGPWLTPSVATPGAPNQVALNDAVVINEIHYHDAPLSAEGAPIAASDEEWIELANRTGDPVDVSGWQIVDAARATFPPGTVLLPFGYLVVARDPLALLAAHPGAPIIGGLDGKLANSGERVLLRDACGNPVDSVRYHDGGRWPAAADGGGSSLELRNPWIDNEIAEAWAASDEAPGAEWQAVTYEGVAAKSAVGPDGQWQELVLGLLDDGVVLLDDVSVVADPYGAAKELIQNGTFDSGEPVHWRIVGNHRHSEVVPDPDDPANNVLRLVATGPTEHMHNHAETTLADGHVITNGVVYRVSYRARWVTGSNLLNSRLYFNRLAKTVRVARPTAHGTPGAQNTAFVDNPGPLFRDLRHAPAVPAAFELVTVSVEAQDPDGIAGLTLWTSVDGGPFAATPMVPTASGRHESTLPGHAPATVVQFYVEAADSLGAFAWFPAEGPESRALWKVDDGLATMGPLQNLRIVLTPADRDHMHASTNLMSNDRMGATVILDEREVHYDVGVRLKGSQRGRPQVARLGWSLAFRPDDPLRGVYRTVMVDRSEGVTYGQREMLVNQMMTHAGSVSGEYNDLVHVIAPRTEHTGAAELQLARFSDLLLDAQFEDGGDGLLYEYELVYYPLTTDDGTPEGYKLPQPDSVVGVGLQSLGADPESYRHTYTVDNNRWRDDFARITTFTQVMGLSGEAFHSQVGAVIDVDQWLRAFAFGVLTGCVDNYTTGSQHNAVLYVRPSDERVLLFPHDLDFYPGSPTSAVVTNGDLKKLIGDPAKARAFYGHLWDIAQTTANDSTMAHWRDHFTELLPGQPFAAHHQFLVQRAQHVLSGAPDSVLNAIPEVPFAITSGVGGALTTDSNAVILQGTGWIDVHAVRRSGATEDLPLAWLDATTWSAELTLPCGTSGVVLTARDRHGAVVGSGAVTVTVSGGACP